MEDALADRLTAYYNHLMPPEWVPELRGECAGEEDARPLSQATLEAARHGWQSQPWEFDYELAVEGEIPPDLHGILYRNGPGLMEVYGTPLVHPIDGDGMVCRVELRDGRAHFRSRFVRTEEFCAEQTRQEMIFSGMMGSNPRRGWKAALTDWAAANGKPAPQKPKFKNPSNTNVYRWGGKVLATWEGGLPYSLDPDTLETVGRDTLGGALDKSRCLAAHFRLDHDRRRLVTFSLRLSLSEDCTLFVHEFDEAWNIVHQTVWPLPQFYYCHDFVLTENFYVVHSSSYYTPFQDLEAVSKGEMAPGETWRLQEGLPAGFHIIPRAGGRAAGGSPRFCQAPPCHIYHHVSAWEEEGRIRFSSVCLEGDFDMTWDDELWLSNASTSPGRLYGFDLAEEGGEPAARTLQDACSCEFPSYDTSRTGRPWRFCYLMAADAPHPTIPYCEVVKFDRLQSRRQVWSARAEGGIVGEPIFVPRPSASSEDDGWVIVQVYYALRHATQYVVLNALDLAAGPVARLKLSHHTPYGFHGTFWQDADL